MSICLVCNTAPSSPERSCFLCDTSMHSVCNLCHSGPPIISSQSLPLAFLLGGLTILPLSTAASSTHFSDSCFHLKSSFLSPSHSCLHLNTSPLPFHKSSSTSPGHGNICFSTSNFMCSFTLSSHQIQSPKQKEGGKATGVFSLSPSLRLSVVTAVR